MEVCGSACLDTIPVAYLITSCRTVADVDPTHHREGHVNEGSKTATAICQAHGSGARNAVVYECMHMSYMYDGRARWQWHQSLPHVYVS